MIHEVTESPLGVGESINRRGESQVKRDGKEPGRRRCRDGTSLGASGRRLGYARCLRGRSRGLTRSPRAKPFYRWRSGGAFDTCAGPASVEIGATSASVRACRLAQRVGARGGAIFVLHVRCALRTRSALRDSHRLSPKRDTNLHFSFVIPTARFQLKLPLFSAILSVASAAGQRLSPTRRRSSSFGCSMVVETSVSMELPTSRRTSRQAVNGRRLR